ncbi:MAG: glycosyltransferase [Anaerolineales bacterium]
MISYHTCPLATLGGKDTGGMNVYVRDLTRYLGMAGVGVDVYTRSQDEHVPHVLHDLGFGNRVVHVPAGPEVPVPKNQLAEYVPTFADHVLSIAQRKGLRYDLIHSHYWLSGLASLHLQAAWGVPFIQMFHTLGKMKERVARSPDEGDLDPRIEAERMLMAKATRVVASTEAELAQFQWLYKADIDRVRVIPPGVDTTRFYPIPRDEAMEFVGIEPGNKMILFVGRLEPLKGIDTLLRAIAQLRADGDIQPECQCLVIIGGDGESGVNDPASEIERLKSIRSDLRMEDLVAFIGSRDQDKLPYYYSAAEVIVVPSHYESFGLVALEAMACGRPVVASETGGLVFLVKDGVTGFHVPAADPEALAEKLRLLLHDKDLRKRLGENARRYASEYAWPKITEAIVDLYVEVLAEPAAAG